MTFISVLRWLHIGAGVVALAAFWVPMVVRKGGAIHRRAGWIYAVAMWVAALMALVICIVRVLDEDKANDPNAIFLAFVGLLAANGASTGIRVLRTKARVGPHRSAFDLGFSALLFASSLALAFYGRSVGSTLYISFSLLGGFLAVGQLRFWLQPPASKLEWWFKHMGNMMAACIGTVTAFLVVNIPRLGLSNYALFVWLAPGVLGGIGIRLWQGHYRRRFALGKAALS